MTRKDPCEDPLFLALKVELSRYQTNSFPKGNSSIQFDKSNNVYSMAIVACRKQFSNMRIGQWTSFWELDANESKLTGNITIAVHYFEEGNVQLEIKDTTSMTLEACEDYEEFARNIFTGVEKYENEILTAINEAYDKLRQIAFRRLRRLLPIMKSKMNWKHIRPRDVQSSESR